MRDNFGAPNDSLVARYSEAERRNHERSLAEMERFAREARDRMRGKPFCLSCQDAMPEPGRDTTPDIAETRDAAENPTDTLTQYIAEALTMFGVAYPAHAEVINTRLAHFLAGYAIRHAEHFSETR